MNAPVTALPELLQRLQPVLHPGVYVFCMLPPDAKVRSSEVVATFREAEGLSVIVEESIASRREWRLLFRASWLTLSVHSDLAAVGLTAAVASALADAGISCNVVAAAHHDHLFVPAEDGERALAILVRLQSSHASPP